MLHAFHILNNFDIPKGSVRPAPSSETSSEKSDEEPHYDHTLWTYACDLKSNRFYFHTYDSRRIRMVYLMKCALDAENLVKIKCQNRSQFTTEPTKAWTSNKPGRCLDFFFLF